MIAEEFIGGGQYALTHRHPRHSIREYQDTVVPPEVIRSVFGKALRAPSWKNTQPWQVYVVTGAVKDRLAAKLTETALSGQPLAPEIPWVESYPSDVRKRMFDLGMRVYGVAGIDRKDKKARDDFMLQNFRFFGAPVAAFITTRLELSFWTALDIGCFLNSIMLLAREEGLGSCPQAALSAFPSVVRGQLGFPEEERLVCGISLGYPKPDSRLNTFHAPRESFDQMVKIY
ncbi:MAG: nitroreductase [Spirochaetia bacterium]|nr:nitroreductase [Spirochaetia bacterium]